VKSHGQTRHTMQGVEALCDVCAALHEMQTRSSDEKAVRPSVRQTRELWQNGRKICPDFIPYEKSFSL